MSDIDIDNETAVLNEAAAEAEAAKLAAATPAPTPEVVVETPEPATPDPVLVAIAEQTAATRALAEQVAAANRPADPVVAETPPRDFDAEIVALRTAYNADDSVMTQEEYEAQRDAIKDAQRDAKTQKDIADALAAQEAARVKAANDLADAQWNLAFATFSSDPGNAAMLNDPIQRAGFEAALKIEYAAAPNSSNETLLANARARVTGVPVVDTSKTTREAAFERQTNAPDPAPTLRDVPSAGPQDGSAGAALDNLNISELEDALARMNPAEVERYLAEAPGGLRDNPRYTG